MDYDFSNGPMASESLSNFSGTVSQRIQNIDEFLVKIIEKRGAKPKWSVGGKIKQFSKLYRNEKVVIGDMRFLNKIRNCLQHGNPQRDMPDSDLYCTTDKGERICITNDLVKEFNKKYLDVYDTLIKLKKS